ncbi:High-affinity choline uptake protein BetT [Pseudonocardia sp. Ae168_Ps1]|nr:High-affinity choline uptake protein BetT [Pseudonocardia sp. Ae168_Ps1]
MPPSSTSSPTPRSDDPDDIRATPRGRHRPTAAERGTDRRGRAVTAPATRSRSTDVAVLGIAGGLLTAFVIAALIVPVATDDGVTVAFDLAARWFGPLWQVLLFATFVVAVGLACSRYGAVRLGGRSEPEIARFKWIAMIMSTLLAGGGVFFAAGEPLQHFVSPSPYYDHVAPGSPDAVAPALAQSFTHWGFLAWAVLGSLGAIVMMRGAEKGLPLRPRTLLHPILGEKVRHSRLGTAVDIVTVLAVVAGTVGPIGFLGLQVSYGLSRLIGTPDTYPVQLAVILGLTAVAVVSVLTGIDRGIQLLSRINIWMALGVLAAFLVLGSAGFLIDAFLGGFGLYLRDFAPLALYRGDEAWLGSWTVFFFGWFLGYGPLMSIFVARISRGRRVRDLIVCTSIVPPVATAVWFTAFGGTSMFLEQNAPGALSGPLESTGMAAAVVSAAEQLPLGSLLGIVLLLLTCTFVATTTDSMSYAIAAASTTRGEPARGTRVFWGLLMGAAAAVLIVVGDGGITALQNVIVITAVPAGFLMLPLLWIAPRVVREMGVEQGVVPAEQPSSGPPSSEQPSSATRDAETEPSGQPT